MDNQQLTVKRNELADKIATIITEMLPIDPSLMTDSTGTDLVAQIGQMILDDPDGFDADTIEVRFEQTSEDKVFVTLHSA